MLKFLKEEKEKYVNNFYLKKQGQGKTLGRGFTKLDTGTHDSF